MHFKQVTACHFALDAESTKYNHLSINVLLVNPAMTNWSNLPIVHKQYIENNTEIEIILLGINSIYIV